MAQATITRPVKYTFSGQHNGVYYWRRPIPGTVTEEVVSCSVTWFWKRDR